MEVFLGNEALRRWEMFKIMTICYCFFTNYKHRMNKLQMQYSKWFIKILNISMVEGKKILTRVAVQEGSKHGERSKKVLNEDV